jgi:RNA polymerase sigma factor (sigma-70 family)
MASAAGEAFREYLDSIWDDKYPEWIWTAQRLVGDVEDAKDIVQEAVYSCLRTAPEVVNEESADAYVRAAVRRRSLHLVRQRRKWRWVSWDRGRWVTLASCTKSAVDEVLEEEQDLENQRLIKIAKQGVQDLPDDLREVLALGILDERQQSLRTIAKMLGISASGVRLRMKKALEALRELDDAFRGGGVMAR